MNAITDPRRDFVVGEEGIAGGMRYRIDPGRKKEGDLILKLWDGKSWVPIGMELGGMLADFHYQVEENLYPRNAGFKGGEKYFEHMRRAVKNGWRFAGAILTAERQTSQAQPKLFDWEAEGIFE